MWKLLYKSVQGSSHRQNGTPCQDSCFAIETCPPEEVVAVLACSDGAGSASLSQVGSELACRRFIELVCRDLDHGLALSSVDRGRMASWFSEVRASLLDEATRLSTAPRELACTLLTAVLGESASTFAQVGDGFMVTRGAAGLDVVFWPQTGEYANVTNFLTDEDFESNLEFSLKERVDETAISTDGLQRLALQFGTRTAHPAFFERLFNALKEAENPDELVAPLIGLLDSPDVNKRTDDDKTLVLASRR